MVGDGRLPDAVLWELAPTVLRPLATTPLGSEAVGCVPGEVAVGYLLVCGRELPSLLLTVLPSFLWRSGVL